MYAVDLYRRVRRACHVEGMGKSEAARMFGIDRKTVAKILKHSVPPGYRRMSALRQMLVLQPPSRSSSIWRRRSVGVPSVERKPPGLSWTSDR